MTHAASVVESGLLELVHGSEAWKQSGSREYPYTRWCTYCLKGDCRAWKKKRALRKVDQVPTLSGQAHFFSSTTKRNPAF